MSPIKPIYLDYNATTPIDPDVLETMLPYLREHFGNPSSNYVYGTHTKDAVYTAREQVAQLIGAKPEEIIFTSGGSESNNHAIIGTAFSNQKRGNHIVTLKIEHPAVIEPLRYLEDQFGFDVTYLSVDEKGRVSPQDVEQAITDKTILITIMHANNEIGTIEPNEKIGQIAKEHGVIFHSDAAQACGKIEVNVDKQNVQLLTIAGHKLYAPKGIGALYVRKGVNLTKYLHGAGQEMGRRAGTENVPYIIGLGHACEIASRTISDFGQRIAHLRDQLYSNIRDGLGSERVRLNGHPVHRLPNTLNISIPGIIGEELLQQIPEIAASTGSACHTGSTDPSQVLLELGLTREQALGALRLSLGRWSTKEEINEASQFIVQKVLSLI